MSKQQGDLKSSAIEKYFNNLNLADWSISHNQKKSSGRQGDVLYVEKNDGFKGVFKKPKIRKEDDIKRFIRDIKIVTQDENKHPNIINILEYSISNDEYWYISERGNPLDKYRKKLRKKYEEDSDKLVEKVVELIIGLLEGLAPLHKAGVIHRDIKDRNIVVVNGKLVLIDFGLAYDEDGDRITPEDEAVGNVRYAHDLQRYYLNNPIPWLDVFMISQLLVWFLEKKPPKNWNRPVDWRFVKYFDGISTEYESSLRVITALCSEESISPKNAGDLKKLFNYQFPVEIASRESSMLNLSGAKKAFLKGSNDQRIKIVNSHKVIESSFPPIKKLYEQIKEKLSEMEYDGGNVAVKIMQDSSISSFFHQLKNNDNVYNSRLYELRCGNEMNNFQVMIQITCCRPDLDCGLKYSEELNIFSLYIARTADIPRNKFAEHNRSKRISVNKSGLPVIGDPNLSEYKITSTEDVIDLIVGWIEDEDAWEAISKDR